MKNYLLSLVIPFYSSLIFAAPHENLGCYNGPLYRAMIGDTVMDHINGSKTVSLEDKVLLQCKRGGNQCSGGYNDYTCVINFDSLSGLAAEKVYTALAGNSVQIGSKIVVSECGYTHCEEVSELSCISADSCSVSSYLTGWDE